MDLKVKDVAKFLNVSNTTIRKWLLESKIPAYKLNGQYRFNLVEIENWMVTQKQTIEKAQLHEIGQIYPIKKEGMIQTGNQQYSLYRAIHKGNVEIVHNKNKEEVIRLTMKQVASQMQLDADVLAELLLDREKLMPTALGDGIAVPHARDCLQGTCFDLVQVVILETPIEYGALDGKPVDLLFFLFATEDKAHLHLLAKIAHFTSDEASARFLRTKPEKNKLLEYVREWESKTRTSHVS